MKIKELYIRSFGKLKDYKLSLSDGVNVLFGSNEAGKTTIFNFILAMLYGLANSRGKELSDNARKKYMTWGESKIGGTMTLEHNGVLYIIDRTFGKTKAGDSLIFTNRTLGEQVSLPSGREVGEYLFDLDEKSFKGTCFIGQLSKDDVCENDGVRTKLSNLSNVGDASYSFDDVFNRLKKISSEVTRNTPTGKIYPLELKKNELEDKNRILETELRQISSIDEENKELESRASELSAELSEVQTLLDNAQKYKAIAEYKKALETNRTVERLNSEYQEVVRNATRNGFTADRAYIDKLNFLLKKRDDAKLKYEYEERALENEKEKLEILVSSNSENKSNPSALPFVIGIIAAVAVAALLFVVLKNIIVSAIVLAVAVVAFICAFVISNGKSKSEANDEQNKLSLQKAKLTDNEQRLKFLKDEYIACDNEFVEQYMLFFEKDEIDRVDENIKTLTSMVGQCVKAESLCFAAQYHVVSQETLDKMRADIGEADLNMDVENVDVHKLEGRKHSISKELLNIEKALLVNKERAKGKGKAEAEIENNLADIAEINEKIKAYKYANDCLELAKSGLEKAQSQMQQQFAPDVSNLVAEILTEITDGKYSQMTLNSKLQAMVVDSQSGAAYEDGFMSAGTLDQIYLALRFAMVNMIFDGKDFPTICMDDALLNFDFERMKKASEYICSVLSEKAQVLFFTCRDTEKNCFSTANLLAV